MVVFGGLVKFFIFSKYIMARKSMRRSKAGSRRSKASRRAGARHSRGGGINALDGEEEYVIQLMP